MHSKNIEGEKIKAILQDIQFHPVSDIILHADFLELNEGKSIKMEIPVSFTGDAPGVRQGGKILTRLRKLTVKSLPKYKPGKQRGKAVRVMFTIPINYTLN